MFCDITPACFTTYLRMSHIYQIPQLANFIAPPCDRVFCVSGVQLVHCSNDLDFNSENSGSNRGWDTGYLRSSWFSSTQVKSRVPPWLSHPRPLLLALDKLLVLWHWLQVYSRLLIVEERFWCLALFLPLSFHILAYSFYTCHSTIDTTM